MRKVKNIYNRTFSTSLFTLIFLLCLFSGYQNAFAGEIRWLVEPLVETSWLEDNLNDPDIRLVYVGDMSSTDKGNFYSRHIPGSVYLSADRLMDLLGDGSTPPDTAQFETLMGELGISNSSHIVVYGSGGSNPYVSGALWLMKYNSCKFLSYLNGGLLKWTAEGRQTTAELTKITPSTYSALPYYHVYADADYVQQNINNSDVVIIDARGSDEYLGIKSKGKNRTGHIPGAINLNFSSTNLNNDETFKSIDELKSAYESKGITKDKEIIVYSQEGLRSTHTYFVLQFLLKYPNVKNYVGSINEWSKLDSAKYRLKK